MENKHHTLRALGATPGTEHPRKINRQERGRALCLVSLGTLSDLSGSLSPDVLLLSFLWYFPSQTNCFSRQHKSSRKCPHDQDLSPSSVSGGSLAHPERAQRQRGAQRRPGREGLGWSYSGHLSWLLSVHSTTGSLWEVATL